MKTTMLAFAALLAFAPAAFAATENYSADLKAWSSSAGQRQQGLRRAYRDL